MLYFNDCSTIEDVKATYRRLAKELHPDCGGSAELFRAMMEEYKIAFNQFKNIHTKQDGTTYEKETTETPEQFANIINSVIHMEGVKIEIIGSWVWLSGNTYPHKDRIKEAGFFYSKTKKSWYYNGDPQKSRIRGHYTMDKLREKWGCVTVDNEPQPQLT